MPSPHTPRRIACLQPSATVILAAIRELDRVIACTKYCADVVPEVANSSRTILADSWTADSAQLITAQPDLVIASVPYQEKAVIEILKAGVPFLGLAPRKLADIYSDIAMIAGVIGAGNRGEEVIANMQRRIEQVRDSVGKKTTESPRPKVFCEEWGKPLIASQAWIAELVEAVGGEFVGEPGKQISKEEVARLNPEILIAAWCGADDRVPLEKSWSTVAGREFTQCAPPGFIAFATSISTRLRPLCCVVWTRWPLRFIPNFSTAPRASVRLPACNLPQPGMFHSELRFLSCLP
jgi:iron complex transport system substrate-binding protein